jgi:hypothetical protein
MSVSLDWFVPGTWYVSTATTLLCLDTNIVRQEKISQHAWTVLVSTYKYCKT